MIKTRILPSLSLLILLLAACAPAAPATELPAQQPVTPIAVEPTATPILSVVEEQPPIDSTLASATPLPIATSRGPNLEATDPSMVSLASGGLQFVEFFRFT